MASGLNFGVKASLPHFFGICFGFPSMILAVGFGLGYVFERYAWLHALIQLVGIVYLIYLAWLIFRAAPRHERKSISKPLTFLQAALFQWVNPKAWIMGTSAIAAYTTVGAELYLQVLVLVFVFWLMTFPSAGVWMMGGVWLQRVLTNPVHSRLFNVVMALLLVASVLPILAELIAKYWR
ncbi:lysine transporter LysE [Arenicella chitinivorans]|uniref:Lysine transporter LysE n=2 Tax=Arenicella chitinivorans TaxID=1329800 RepID=A0A918VK66_9GAMM|nr:lysine transporter LysE [Arenicella chitinivorans]